MPPIDDLERKLSELSASVRMSAEKVDKIYVALFGVEGAGGSASMGQGHQGVKLDGLEKEVTLARGKMIGIAVGISGFISLIGFMASKLIK
jgi:hypothetical protein